MTEELITHQEVMEGAREPPGPSVCVCGCGCVYICSGVFDCCFVSREHHEGQRWSV